MTKKTQNQEAQIQASNEALLSALCSAHRRGLLVDEPSYDVARKVSIAASHYYKLNTGQMTEQECCKAVEACFDYKPKPKSPVF